MARRPVAPTSLAVSSRSGRARAATATSAPASASATAIARPSPRLAPVTMATRPSRRGAAAGLSVEGIEQLPVFVRGDPALDLQSGREQAVLHREVAGQDRGLLDPCAGLEVADARCH